MPVLSEKKTAAEAVKIANPGPKRRFTYLLIFIHGIALPVISVIAYLILKQNAVADAYNAGKLYLSSMSAVKHYVGEELRPIFYSQMPNRFVLEGMSRSYAAAEIARRVGKEMPDYIYKNASLNPRNPLNSADEFEKEIILGFRNNKKLTEWKGFSTGHDGRFYVIARPGEPFQKDCLSCHGDPVLAPEELKARYGSKNGFHMRQDEIADAIFVYVPISVPLAAARKAVGVFIGLYVLVGTLVFLAINGRFASFYDIVDRERQRIEDINSELINLNRDMESVIAERTMNLVALSVADRVRNPASVIAGTFNRMLRKEELPEPLRERVSGLVSEAQKLEKIVRDYENILKTRHAVFGLEDLNDILKSVLPLIENESKSRNIRISLELAASPVPCMANRQFLQVAFHHLLKNALEAAKESGEVTVKTAIEGNSALFMVYDNGIGIPAETALQVWELFYTTKRYRMGMGLPLVKQIVEEHKGKITVESTPGDGTHFRIALPLRWSGTELSES